MRAAIHIFLSLSLALSLPASAESRDEKLLKDGSATAGRVISEDLVKGYLDKITGSSVQAGGTAAAQSGASASANAGNAANAGSGVSAGGAFVFAVSLGFSISDFAKAKSDKAKGFAVANAIAAGISLAFPPAGLIVSAVLLVVHLVDASVSAAHAKWMMEIYTRINNLYADALKMENQMLAAEKERFIAGFEQLQNADASVKLGQNYLEDNCSDSASIDSLEKADSCLKSVVQVVEEYQRLVDISESLLNPATRIIKSEDVFKYAKLDREKFKTGVDAYKSALGKMRAAIDDTLHKYGEWMADLIRLQAQDNSAEYRAQFFKTECLSIVRKLNIQSIILSDQERFRGIDAFPGQNVSSFHQLRDLIRQFQFSGCSSVPSGDERLDQLYNDMNILLLTNLKAIQQEDRQ